MTNNELADLIEKMPQGMTADDFIIELVTRAVVIEREACAKVCDTNVDGEYATGKVDHNEIGWTQVCANLIRARGEK